MKTLTALVTVLFMAQPLMSLSAPVAASTAKKAETANPLLRPFKNTEHNTPPFNAIDNSMWLKAIQEGITRANKDIDAIASQKAKPTFKNTIEALDCAGEDLSRVLGVFYALLSAEADDQMMEVSVVASRLLSEYSTSITLNEKLWQRVRQVYDNRDALKLVSEDSMLLQRTYESFARNGATLEGEARQQYKNLSSELSELTTLFGQNVLKEVNTNDNSAFEGTNRDIADYAGASHMLRIGAEIRPVASLAVRAGYNLTTTGERQLDEFGKKQMPKNADRHAVSAGLGFSSKGSFFADLAVRGNFLNREYIYPYADYIFDGAGNTVSLTPEILNRKSLWDVVLTFGFRF